jgi:hypothetical protein
MAVSGQLHAPAGLLLGKQSPLPIEYDAGWASETVRALLEKPPVVQLLKNVPAFYKTRMFIIVFTRVLHCSLP